MPGDGAIRPAAGPGATKVIAFAHANGFPAGTYRALFDVWRAAGWDVRAIDRLGHDPRFPVSNNWPHLREEFIAFIEREVGGAAYLVGHSLGGFVSLLAASRRPDLARGVVLLDSPVLAGWKAHAVRFAKASRLVRHVSPGKVSVRRRQHWPSAEAAHAHFAAKPAFARWAPGVLADYIASGVEPGPEAGSHVLRFRREIETAIYDSVPHHVARVLRCHPLQCPLAFVGGSESVEVRQIGLAATRTLTQGRLSTIDGSGHLFPFEKPVETGRRVLDWIGSFGEAAAAAGRRPDAARPHL